MTSHNLR